MSCIGYLHWIPGNEMYQAESGAILTKLGRLAKFAKVFRGLILFYFTSASRLRTQP